MIDTRSRALHEMSALERAFVRAFGRGVLLLASTASVSRLAEGEYEPRPDVWTSLATASRRTLEAGGAYAMSHLPRRGPVAPAVLAGFSGDSRRAQAWLAERSSRLIQELQEEQAEAVREVLQMARGERLGPREAARLLVGRGPNRESALIGLNRPQASAVLRAREELSGPEGLSAYLQRGRRDRRFDGLVRRAMREGRGLSEAEIDRVAGRYSARLLRYRAETIARTETMAAFGAGRDEGLGQVMDRGNIPSFVVSKTWRTTRDGRERDGHAAMHGQTVGIDEPFIAPDGARLLRPGDSSLGAGPKHMVNCRCWAETRIDYAMLSRWDGR